MTLKRPVKRAPWLVATGAITGFIGVIAFHIGASGPIASASRATAPGPSAGSGPAKHSAGNAGGQTGAVRTATGPAVNFGYGTISVRATVRGRRIVAVSVARLSVLEATSGQICGQAIPILRQEVLSAHTASINGVSGATFTSQGYVNSLQAALSDLHV